MRVWAGVACAVACVALPASASADLLEFTGGTGKQSGTAWFPNAGLRAYNLSVTVNGAVQGCRGDGPSRRCRVEVSVGEFFSTGGFPAGAKIVWGLRYRRESGSWHGACVPDSHNCIFTMPGGMPWPGNPAGGQYFPVRMWARAPRNIYEVQVNWGPITESQGQGAWIGAWPRSKTFRVRYHMGDGLLPSRAVGAPPPEPVPTPAPPASSPAPAPPPPAPPPPQDTCVGHPSDPSVVCTRDGGHIVDVCDRDPDGHYAYARVVTEATHPTFQSPFYDGNGSQAGCENIRFDSRVTGIAVCVQYESCSAIQPTGPQPGT